MPTIVIAYPASLYNTYPNRKIRTKQMTELHVESNELPIQIIK